MRVYIAGPMTGLPDYNYPAFFEAEGKIADTGADVFNPARHGIDPQKTHEEYMREALLDLCCCDAMVLLPGWENSQGALVEIVAAKAMGVKIYATIADFLSEYGS